jgi:hypothetical protein
MLGAAALTVAGGAGLAGCGGAKKNHVKTSGPVPVPDVAILSRLLDLEYETIAAYEAGIPLLAPKSPSAMAAQQFLHHELSHAGELAGMIRKAGVKKAPKPRLSYPLGHPSDAAGVLELFHRLESAQLAAYQSALPLLSDGAVRAGLAAVSANDAQHVAILRSLQGHTAAPAAFVTGRE